MKIAEGAMEDRGEILEAEQLLQVSVSAPMMEIIDALLKNGLHGRSREEVARRLLETQMLNSLGTIKLDLPSHV